jgi:Putative beta-barrel porin-2, OmpL-like. bbp2
MGAAGALALVGAFLPCGASEAETPWYRQITFNAFVSSSYSYNFNRPASGSNGYRVFDFNDNSFTLDVAEFVVQKAVSTPRDVGFRVDLELGSSIPQVVAAADPGNGGTGGQRWDVQQGFVSWVAPLGSGLRLDLGKFVTPFGYELIDGYDGYNDNATRSFLFGYAIPFTHTGLRASYAFNGTVSAMLMVVNGWDNAKDNNSGKTVGAQVSLTPTDTLTLCLNGMIGPERDRDTSDQRTLLEIDATWKVTKRLTLGLNLDRGTERNAPLSPSSIQDVSWSGAALYARFAVTPRFALAARVEQFDDRDGWRTGSAQTLRELTLTPEFRVGPHLVLRGDLRTDRSDAEVFEKADGGTTRRQTTALVNALVIF